jgi:hypothetical protein
VKREPHTLFWVCREPRQVAMEKSSLQLNMSTRDNPREDILRLLPREPSVPKYHQPDRLSRHNVIAKQLVPRRIESQNIVISSFSWSEDALAKLPEAFRAVEEIILVSY